MKKIMVNADATKTSGRKEKNTDKPSWEPKTCPKDDGEMAPIPGMDEAWKCIICGLEVWDGDVPSTEEYSEMFGEKEDKENKMTLQSASYKPFVSRSFVQLPPGAQSSKSGRRRKKKKKKTIDAELERRYHDKT